MTVSRLALAMAVAGLVATGCSSTASSSSPAIAAGITTQWFAATAGKFLVQGAILQKYNEVGASNSALGSPISNEQAGPGGGRYTKFEGGGIYWTPQTGAHIVMGAIRDTWKHDYGGPGGPLGYPTRDQQDIPGGWQQTFQHGTITYTNGKTHVQPQP
ncbi:hypothetical protein JMUB5695_04299 [Mycobacterium heckeshornense]|uniref:LGFP repeat-containing protein n=1 Tax=Mycobacterium heckeshornense TaxID=110505 RepID=UPI001AF3A00B|nr:esterase [Mycobacterium heckeshornense]BCQ10840.1 hypothetical protein JMUB5695_04299 [Mycobacterium heckeshornense]